MDNENQSYLAIYGPPLLGQGYDIVPIRPGLKHPGKKNWQSMPSDATALKGWLANGYAGGGVGIRTRNTPAVDIDVLDPGLAEAMAAFVTERLGATPTRIGQYPKRALIYRTAAPFSKVTSRVFTDWEGEHRVEILGDGQQIVAHHIHPTTGEPYRWSGDGLAGIPAAALPEITLEDARAIVAEFEALAPSYGLELKDSSTGSAGALQVYDDPDEAFLANYVPTKGWTPEDALKRLRHIDPDDRDTWIKVGMGLHHEFGGSVEGFELWDAWSQGSAKYGGVDWERWVGFEANLATTHPRNAGTIQNLAEEGREKERAARARESGFSVAWWGEVSDQTPPPRQLIEEVLAYGQASLIAAQPNTGKSVLSLDMAICVATGTPWRDKDVEQGTVLYIAAESPETIKARTLAERRARGITGEIPLAVVQNPICLTTHEDREAFRAMIGDWMAGNPRTNLITLDTFRNATPGLSENDSEAVGPVIHLCHALAREHNVHFQIDHHTTKSGAGYAGSGVLGAVVDTEILIVRGEDDLKDLLCARVQQQRGLNSRGEEYWYEIGGRETGRVTNFGKPETAPVLKRHWLGPDLDFRKVRVAEEKEAQRVEALDADLALVLEAMADGKRSRADLVAATGLSQPRVREAQARGVKTGALESTGEGSGTRYFLPKKG